MPTPGFVRHTLTTVLAVTVFSQLPLRAPLTGQTAPSPTPREATAGPFVLHEVVSGSMALLQAVSAVDDDTVWASGHQGVVLRSVDGGERWERRPVQSLDSLQFRDVHAFSARAAIILSAGEGAASRVYRTDDAGATWTLAWRNEEPAGFYDCLDFWDRRRGLLYGDAVDGGLRILRTDDGGASWRPIPAERLPAPAGSEGGFAASGTCVSAEPDGEAWIVTGAGDRSRVLRTSDYGETWAVTDLPLAAGSAAGAFTAARVDADVGFVLGGDLGRAEAATDNVVRTSDGGRTWTHVSPPPFAGAVYGASAWVGATRVLLAAGPAGLAGSTDDGGTWILLDDRSFWAVESATHRAWAAGPDGRIVVIERERD